MNLRSRAMPDFQIILISSVLPEPTTGGEISLHRHLIERATFPLKICDNQPNSSNAAYLFFLLYRRLIKTRFNRFAEDLRVLCAGRWLDREIRTKLEDTPQAIVFTVAHGDAWMSAMRYARKHKLPLATFFHDWWPDIALVHKPIRYLLESQLKELYRSSSIAFCSSAGMINALGKHQNVQLLYPISESSRKSEKREDCSRADRAPFKVLYMGNLFDYGPMMREALKKFLDDPRIRLEVRGMNPKWPTDFSNEMKKRGMWLDFLPRKELEAWLLTGDFYLVSMSFDPNLKRRMETSFPSKLLEYVQFGKPLIIWGPEYCSAIKWAESGKRAVCVTNSDPEALKVALRELVDSPEEQYRLATEAKTVAQNDFNPNKIHNNFEDLLKKLIQ